MSVTHWWLGENSTTSAKVVCRSNATGTVTVGCNGAEFTGSANTGVNDGVVVVTVSGLSAGNSYAYTIDGADGGTVKTQPQSGEIWIASGSCWAKTREDVLAFKLLADYDIALYLAMGDFPYCNVASALWGESTTDVTTSMANSKDEALYLAHHRQVRGIPGIKDLMRAIPFRYMADDHEYPMDNAAPSYLSQYQTDVTGAGSATQDDLDEAWAAARPAVEAYAQGFTFASTGDADAIYGAFSLPNVDVFVTDCINYRSNPPDTDDASKTMLGEEQFDWLVAAVTASTKPFKLIASGKQFFRGGANADTWPAQSPNLGYITERNALLLALKDVTGLMSVAGDQHVWSDQWIAAEALGATYPAFSCLVGCPTNVELNTSNNAGYDTGVRTRAGGASAVTPNIYMDRVVALFRFSETRVYRYLLSTHFGLMPMGYIDAGSNQVTYAQQKYG